MKTRRELVLRYGYETWMTKGYVQNDNRFLYWIKLLFVSNSKTVKK